MYTATVKSTYFRGIRHGSPFILMAAPFALLYGVLAAEAGLELAEIVGFTLLVIAGAAQFAALQLMIEDAAILFVLMAALAVNLRMAMYSAALVPHLGGAPLWQRAIVAYVNFDQTYMMSVNEYEQNPTMTLPEKLAYFMGVATPITPVWVGASIAGAIIGEAIPADYSIDFIMPLMFLAMVAPMLKSLAHVAAAAVSILVALALSGLPSGTGLLIAAGCAMLTGALLETWLEQRS